MISKYFLSMLIALSAVPAFSSDWTVSRISVAGTTITDPSVVRNAFLEVAIGQSLSEERLEEAVELAKSRLVTLGYFSSVDVTVVRSLSRPGTVALVAEVVEGFLYRFGGGPYWAFVGLNNLGGQAKDAGFWLGWNRQAVAWTDRTPGWPGGSWSVEGGNRPRTWVDSSGSRRETQALGASAALAQDWGWGWETGLRTEANVLTDARYQEAVFQSIPAVWVRWSRISTGFSPDRGALARVEVSTGFPEGWIRSQGDARAYLPLGGRLKAALRLAGIHTMGDFSPRDAVMLSGLDGVRKPFDPQDRGRGAAWSSAELRWAIAGLGLEPALLFDAGVAWDRDRAPVVWAAGGALRVFFDSPVFVPLRLEGTLDNQNRWQIGFGVSPPF